MTMFDDVDQDSMQRTGMGNSHQRRSSKRAKGRPGDIGTLDKALEMPVGAQSLCGIKKPADDPAPTTNGSSKLELQQDKGCKRRKGSNEIEEIIFASPSSSILRQGGLPSSGQSGRLHTNVEGSRQRQLFDVKAERKAFMSHKVQASMLTEQLVVRFT